MEPDRAYLCLNVVCSSARHIVRLSLSVWATVFIPSTIESSVSRNGKRGAGSGAWAAERDIFDPVRSARGFERRCQGPAWAAKAAPADRGFTTIVSTLSCDEDDFDDGNPVGDEVVDDLPAWKIDNYAGSRGKRLGIVAWGGGASAPPPRL